MEFIIPLMTFISGMVLAYIGYRYQVSRDKLNTKRERLLNNISKVERFLALTLELENIALQVGEIKRKHEKIREEVVQIEENKLNPVYTDFEEGIKQKEEALSELNKRSKELDDTGRILEAQQGRLEEMLKEISMSDIDVICKMIDSSNKLGKCLTEMAGYHQKLFQDIENNNYIRKIRDLRYEILKLLDAKIN
jgi:hypothetical protein